MFSSSMRRTDVSATAVMGPLVSGDRTTSKKRRQVLHRSHLAPICGRSARTTQQSSSCQPWGRCEVEGSGVEAGGMGDALTMFPEEPSTKQTEIVQQWVVSDLIVLHRRLRRS